jgi:hypothetical protein
MATLAKRETIIVNLTPEDINKRLAESILISRGKDFSGMAHIRVDYDFGPNNAKLRSARVEIWR